MTIAYGLFGLKAINGYPSSADPSALPQPEGCGLIGGKPPTSVTGLNQPPHPHQPRPVASPRVYSKRRPSNMQRDRREFQGGSARPASSRQNQRPGETTAGCQGSQCLTPANGPATGPGWLAPNPRCRCAPRAAGRSVVRAVMASAPAAGPPPPQGGKTSGSEWRALGPVRAPPAPPDPLPCRPPT